MSVLPEAAHTPIESKDDLIRFHASGEKPKSGLLIGTEHEKFVLDAATHALPAYDGPRGIRTLLESMKRFGFEAVMEGDQIIGLQRGREAISLEPAGQFELSGAPLPTLHDMGEELDRHIIEANTVAQELGLTFMPLGYHPTLTTDNAPWMPKGRYAIMRDYMPKVGTRGLEMMQLTCTTQVNLDYINEKDMARKMRTALALQPVVVALFANSPFKQGAANGFQSNRFSVWNDVDEARCGVPKIAFEDGFGYERYVDYALDVPMYFVYRNGTYIDCAGQSFRDFMAGKLPALPNEKPQLFDYINHLTTLFPDVRLKTYLEMRGADVGNALFIKALPALWTGLLYDDTAFAQAEGMVADWSHADVIKARIDVPQHGMDAVIAGQKVQTLAKKIVTLSVQGLRRRAIRRGANNADETKFLEPLVSLVDFEQTESQRLIALYEGPWGKDINKAFEDVRL